MGVSFIDFCMANNLKLLDEWDDEKNGSLSPLDLTTGSNRKVWWCCEKGHSYEASVCARVGRNSGCPYCSGKRVWPGMDLASLYPELSAQWHPVKNGDFKPDAVSPGSNKRVWWVCELGHEWQSVVKARARGSKCPVCKRKIALRGVNDLELTHPEIAAQWHDTKNGDLRPSDVVSGSRDMIWWCCEKGHEWCSPVCSRSRGHDCPVCTGRVVVSGENDLASCFPELLEEWNYEKNAPLTPQEVTGYSNCKVWWVCEKGHEWEAEIGSRSFHGYGCPYCAGRKVMAGFNDLSTVYPKVAEQWHPTLNGDLTPQMVTKGCNKKIWWKCDEGHVWQAVVYSRTTQNTGCPVCAGVAKKRIHYKR